jgi:hypothetical protein
MDIMRRWGAVESDFLRFYSISNPLEYPWRKFMNNLSNLPVDKSIFYAPMYNAYMNDEEYDSSNGSKPKKGWWKQELDQIRNRRRPRSTMSLDSFVKQSGGKIENK